MCKLLLTCETNPWDSDMLCVNTNFDRLPKDSDPLKIVFVISESSPPKVYISTNAFLKIIQIFPTYIQTSSIKI